MRMMRGEDKDKSPPSSPAPPRGSLDEDASISFTLVCAARYSAGVASDSAWASTFALIVLEAAHIDGVQIMRHTYGSQRTVLWRWTRSVGQGAARASPLLRRCRHITDEHVNVRHPEAAPSFAEGDPGE